MAKLSVMSIIGVVIAALIVGVLLPIGLNEVLAFQSSNSTIQTLVATVLPILAVVGLIMTFIPKSKS